MGLWTTLILMLLVGLFYIFLGKSPMEAAIGGLFLILSISVAIVALDPSNQKSKKHLRMGIFSDG